MHILRKDDNSPITRTCIYKKLSDWIKEEKGIKQLRSDVKEAHGDFKIELFKKYRKMYFFETFVSICMLATENIMITPESKLLINNIVGSVVGRLIFETSNICDLKEIFEYFDEKDNKGLLRWVNNRRNGKIWIDGSFIDTKIGNLIDDFENIRKRRIGQDIDEKNWQLTFEDYAKYEFALMSGSSYTDVESMMARGISRTSLCNILYSFIITRRLMESLGDDFILNWYEDDDLIIGNSGVSHYFDGIITLEKRDYNNPWLFKCISMCHNPLQSIESIETKLADTGANRCLLFLPMYPSQNAMRYSMYSYARKHFEIIPLYLPDLYNIITCNESDVREYIKNKGFY